MIDKDKFTDDLSKVLEKYGITTSVAIYSDGVNTNDIVLISGTTPGIMIAQLVLSKCVFESVERRMYGGTLHDHNGTIQ